LKRKTFTIYMTKGYSWAFKRDFWTSGTSKGCPGLYQWCPSRKLDISEAKWQLGHPNSTEENCIFVNYQDKLSGGNSSLGTSKCDQKKRFVCEARDIKK
jgi:hypothetical protein